MDHGEVTQSVFPARCSREGGTLQAPFALRLGLPQEVFLLPFFTPLLAPDLTEIMASQGVLKIS